LNLVLLTAVRPGGNRIRQILSAFSLQIFGVEFSLDMRGPIIVTWAFVLSGHTGAAAPSRSFDLGLLTNYYHDCPASRGPHAAYVRKVLRRALAGDHAAMRTVIMLHDGLFSTAITRATARFRRRFCACSETISTVLLSSVSRPMFRRQR
jgi:hypothetical protein